MTAQVAYKDGNGSTRAVHMDSRPIAGSTADVPVVRPVSGSVDFGASATGNVFDAVASSAGVAAKRSSDFACDGFEFVVLHIEKSAGGGALKLRPWAKDATGHYSPLPEVTVTINVAQDSAGFPTFKTNWFHCELVVVPTHGAKYLKFELTTHNNGNVSVWACGR